MGAGSIPRGNDAFILHHQNDGALRRAGPVHHALGYDETPARVEFHGVALKINEQLPFHDVEEFVVL
jgi:hypothetical protein